MSTQQVLKVEGMTCGHCVARVEKALRAVEGVSSVQVSLAEGRATVESNGASTEALVAAVVDAGYEATV
jgi:copper ion binding protein